MEGMGLAFALLFGFGMFSFFKYISNNIFDGKHNDSDTTAMDLSEDDNDDDTRHHNFSDDSVYSSHTASNNDSDWMYDPVYSHMPGNVYYTGSSLSSRSLLDTTDSFNTFDSDDSWHSSNSIESMFDNDISSNSLYESSSSNFSCDTFDSFGSNSLSSDWSCTDSFSSWDDEDDLFR